MESSRFSKYVIPCADGPHPANVRIPLTDWAQNAHSLTVQRGQNVHYVPSLYRVLDIPGILQILCRTACGAVADIIAILKREGARVYQIFKSIIGYWQ